jgi:Hemerythrin HHE cation binding domain
MSSATRTDQRPNVHEMYVIHRVFRREFTALPGLIRKAPASDAARAKIVGEHLRLVLGGLHMHHTGEDEVLWPRLLERAAPSTNLVETMQSQHERVDVYAGQVGPLLDDWIATGSPVRGEQLARLLEDFAAALFEHLDLEEREVLPLITRHITVAEWNSLGAHGRGAMPARQLPVLFGSILEDADDHERAMMLATLPLPVRLLMTTVGGGQYRRYIKRVRAV